MTEQDIFLAALEIKDPAQRTEYLNRACIGNPVLRRQVEELLAVHERSGEFLDVPVLEQVGGDVVLSEVVHDADSTKTSDRQDRIDLSFLQPSTKPGSLGQLGHYEIHAVLGRGGCGIVLKGFDTLLQRFVAIKVMAPELAATSPARKRFLREAQAAAALRHENVVGIYAVEDQPLPYLVMEYISGPTLQQHLDRMGPLDPVEVVRIGLQIARGLEAAHALGLIHRDIKPGNVLLEGGHDLGEPGALTSGVTRVKITDFGLARTADDASITQSGHIAGTPLYMSPEQALGQPLDPRSDLFSFGSVLYTMTSGRPPFRAANTLAVLKRVAEDEPRPIREIIPETPDWLCAIIAKLHAKNRDDRFSSAQEVADLLARCLSDLQQRGRVESFGAAAPVVPKPTASPTEPIAPASVLHPRSPHRRRWLVAATLLITLFAGLGLTEATGVTNVRSTVIRLFSPDGTLIVEVDDPNVSVSIDGADMVITGAGAKEIRLQPGQYKLLASREGKVVQQELVTVTRNGRQVVRVSKEAVPPPAADVPPLDPQRAAAQTLSDLGLFFHVRMHQDGKMRYDVRLPQEPCDVHGVIAPGVRLARSVVETKFLPALLKLEHLDTINSGLVPVPLTAEDLSRLADGPAGRQLDWLNCRLEPSSEILRVLGRFPKLGHCTFHGRLYEDDMVRFCRELPRGITGLGLWLDRRSRMDERGITALTALPLERLFLTYAQFDRAFARKVATMPHLREFYPVHWGTDCPLDLTDEIAEELAASQSLDTLRLQGN
ncbi:MAG: serine/threonine-protein kinase, partial [Gemmataceae bacterium]|nr:serine/threonine-protein kinase [Gemmataceae bacterium]